VKLTKLTPLGKFLVILVLAVVLCGGAYFFGGFDFLKNKADVTV
jgi:hypothetical protein